jgi:general secretion pathway protein A
MYTQFYNLERKPFEITPDPRFLYTSVQHKEALANLLYGVKERKGLMVLTGEVGTGKTLLIRSLLQMLDANTHTAFVFNPRLELEDFFNVVASEFRLRGDLSTKGRFLKRLNSFLLRAAENRKPAVLIVDEAQTLSLPILEEIRLLMNLETSSQKLLQVILAGQPELHKIINFNCMRQFKQRIGLRCHLSPLSKDETAQYIERRLQVAGHRGERIFTDGAIRRIHQYANGIPRIINVVCDNALLTGYALEKKRIDPPVIQEVIGDLDGMKSLPKKTSEWPRDESDLAREWTGRERPRKSRRRWAVGAVAVLVLAVVLLLLFPTILPQPLSQGVHGLLGR